jgi:hypothetical protein
MGFFKWLGDGVNAVNKFFDSVYMRLPYTVRGLIWGFGMLVTLVVLIGFWPVNLVNELLDFLGGLLNPWGK